MAKAGRIKNLVCVGSNEALTWAGTSVEKEWVVRVWHSKGTVITMGNVYCLG